MHIYLYISTIVGVSTSTTITTTKSIIKLKPLRICIWSPDILDGQRQIWLLQTTHMNRSEYHFIWILDMNTNDNNIKVKNKHSIYHSLVLLPNVTIVNHPTLVVSIGKDIIVHILCI